MQGKPDWKKYRQQAAEKLRSLRQKPQIIAAAAIFSGSLLLAVGLLAGSGQHHAPAVAAASQAASEPATPAEGVATTVSAPIDLVTPEVADDNASVDDPLTAAEANPEPENALPPATAQNMNPACERYFQRARACFTKAPDGQAGALMQSLEATRGDLSQLDGDGCEVVNRQFEDMVQQMGCERPNADTKPAAEPKVPAPKAHSASAAH